MQADSILAVAHRSRTGHGELQGVLAGLLSCRIKGAYLQHPLDKDLNPGCEHRDRKYAGG